MKVTLIKELRKRCTTLVNAPINPSPFPAHPRPFRHYIPAGHNAFPDILLRQQKWSTSFPLPFSTSRRPSKKTYIAPPQRWSTVTTLNLPADLQVKGSTDKAGTLCKPLCEWMAHVHSRLTRPSRQQDIYIPSGLSSRLHVQIPETPSLPSIWGPLPSHQ